MAAKANVGKCPTFRVLLPSKKKPSMHCSRAQRYATPPSYQALSERTLGRWLQQDAFRAELQRRTSKTYEAVVCALTDAGLVAILMLRSGVTDKNIAGSQIRASNLVLSHLFKAKEQCEVEMRIQRLEEAAAQGNKR